MVNHMETICLDLFLPKSFPAIFRGVDIIRKCSLFRFYIENPVKNHENLLSWQDHIQGMLRAESSCKSSATLVSYARHSSRLKKMKGAGVVNDRNTSLLMLVATDIHGVID